MVEAVFEGVRTYITRSQNTVAQYIASQSILDLCERSAGRPGARVSWWWWEQDFLYLGGGEDEVSGGIGRRGVDRREGENAPRSDDGTGMRSGVQSINLI